MVRNAPDPRGTCVDRKTVIRQYVNMARKKTTVYIDDGVLRAAKIAAARQGKKEYQVVEEALRDYLGLEVLQRVWDRGTLKEDQALKLAYRELHAARK